MSGLWLRKGRRYRTATRAEVLDFAAAYIRSEQIGALLDSPAETERYLVRMIGGYEAEQFHVLMLDNRHRLIDSVTLFRGTIDGASVHPREVVKAVLERNAAAVIFAHNHPGGIPEPSQADEMITKRLAAALALIDVRTLDHIIVTRSGCTSLAARGLL